MNRAYSLKRNAQFQHVYRRGKSVSNPNVALIYVRASKLQVGFSISRKVGKAVVRNRLKRRMREIFSPRIPKLKPGMYVFVARTAAKDVSFAELQRSMENLLSRLRLFEEEK